VAAAGPGRCETPAGPLVLWGAGCGPDVLGNSLPRLDGATAAGGPPAAGGAAAGGAAA
jgi:hypothetical protein